MKDTSLKFLESLIERYPSLSVCRADIEKAFVLLSDAFTNGHKLMIAGNGGSCSDASHIVGELMKGFVLRRPLPEELRKSLIEADSNKGEILASRLQMGLPALSLMESPSLSSAFGNDVENGGVLSVAQNLLGVGQRGDVLLLISTSGNAENLVYADVLAHALGIKTIALTGKTGGALGSSCDVSIVVPNQETYQIQELHLPIYHCLCLMLEEEFFGK